MAVEFDIKGSRTSEYRFLPESLDVQPEMNGRHDLADKLARMVVDEDQSIDKVIEAARAYLKARGV